ncbi:MAG: DUF554 domain-containing protein [Chloroflexota bacterium]|nr:DUF554 domain-containing protein [Chloroflexota bacterium]
MPIGSLVNAITVLVGSAIGMSLRHKFPQKIQAIIFQAVGLATLVLGMKMALQSENFLVLIFSLIGGGIWGELSRLDMRLEKLGEFLKASLGAQDERFTEGLVTAFLIFCVGSMTFVGALNEGLSGDRTLIFTKAILDGFTSMALASVYGGGVLLSALPLFLVQASISLLARQFQGFFTPLLINQLSAVGGVLILGIGINLLEIKQIKTTSLLPALVVVVILTWFFL